MGQNTVFRISVNVIWESTHLPGEESWGGGGYFPKLPKRVCAAQQGRDFGTLSFTAKLGLSCLRLNLSSIDLFNLYVSLPHLRPRDGTLENNCFQILKY